MSVPSETKDQARRGGRSRVKLGLAGAAFLVLAALFAVVYPLPSPEGIYYDPYVGCMGDAFWVFNKGQCSIKTPESSEFVSTYSREDGRWMYRTDRGKTGQFAFKATLLGIHLHDPSGQQPDRFLFRRSFCWLRKAWTWVQLHRP